jgi:hypothetical protein
MTCRHWHVGRDFRETGDELDAVAPLGEKVGGCRLTPRISLGSGFR